MSLRAPAWMFFAAGAGAVLVGLVQTFHGGPAAIIAAGAWAVAVAAILAVLVKHDGNPNQCEFLVLLDPKDGPRRCELARGHSSTCASRPPRLERHERKEV